MRNQNSKFTKLEKIIPESAQAHNLEKQFTKYKIFSIWEKVAPGFFTEAKEQTKPIEFENGKLTIACLSEELGLRLKQVCEQVMRIMNEMLGRKLVYVLVIEM